MGTTNNENLTLWKKVEKTNPAYTKKAKVGGNNITSISPQYQVMNATEQFGSYGKAWGFRNIDIDYSITNIPITKQVQDWNTKQIENIDTVLGLVGFKATFFYPDGEFEITNSIKIFTDNKHSKIDDNYAKKLETDALTKALSKLGFNADIFLGKFDDVRYVQELTQEFNPPPKPKDYTRHEERLKACSTLAELQKAYTDFTPDEKHATLKLKDELKVTLK